MYKRSRRFLLFLALFPIASFAQTPPAQERIPTGDELFGPIPADRVERLSENLYRLGSMQVDTAKREVTVPGKITDAQSLEFLAASKSNFRTYESAIQLDVTGITFNVGMILIGMDREKAVPSKFHFDPSAPKGDPVDVWVEWKAGLQTKRMRAEDLLRDKEKNEPFPHSSWVYTGSEVLADGRYRADTDGVIIGFVHDPSSIIEWTGSNGLGRFGFIKLDAQSGLEPGTAVTIIVKAAAQPSR